ncbi:unnamed protein product [Cuscuta campestris]|uniref:Uncharacterized protein n=1 Tax=Cuscuta campestris TaxID=132261 RepID=A0A484NED4_9ASTE|nr:unnamed protein product [Cuscuta campestris]
MSRLRFSCRIRNVALEYLGSLLSTDITRSGSSSSSFATESQPDPNSDCKFPQILTSFSKMAPSNPTTWSHEPSIIKEDELREVVALLGKGFQVHHPDAVGGISLSHNPNPQKYMVMQYHSVENGFKLPLHGLLRDICRHFGFAPGQLTANAHKYVASYILRCCALDRTPTLDEFLILFSIVYSPLDLPGVILRSSISRTKFAAAALAEAAYYALRDEGGLIPHHSLQDASLYKKADFYYLLGPDPILFEGVSSRDRSKAPPIVEPNAAGSSTGNQTQDNTTVLAVCKPSVALDVVPISAIPRLRRPTLSQKRRREGVTDDDFLPKKNKGDGIPASPSPLTSSFGTQSTTPAAASGGLELPNPDNLDHEGDELPDQSGLKTPAVQSQPEVINTSSPDATIPQGAEEEADRQKEQEASPATEKEASHRTIQANLEKMNESVQEPTTPQARPDLLALNALHSMEQAQQSLLTLSEEYLGEAWGNYRAVVVLKEKELAVRALQQKVDSLEQQVQALQEENAKLKADGSAELVTERSRVKSLQEQIAAYQKGTQDLETQFDRLRAQISVIESKSSASKDKVGSLKAELVERESRISELESSLREAKHEGAHLNDLMLKHMEAKRLTLEKLGKERQIASELRSRMGELEKAIAAHQEEVATLTARAETLYEEGKFECKNASMRVVFIDLTISDFSSDSSSLAFPSLGAPTPELSSGPSLASEQSVTSPLPKEENYPHPPQRASGGVLPGSGVLPNGGRTEVSTGCPGTSRPQKRRNPHSGASRLVSGARPFSQGSPSPQQSYGQQPEEWGDYDVGGNRLPFIRWERDGTFRDPPPPSV